MFPFLTDFQSYQFSSMQQISYRPKTEKSEVPLCVYLEGIKTGEIRAIQGGFEYFPNGQKTAGNILPTVAAVKHTIENDPD